jgi:hypothetical protein
MLSAAIFDTIDRKVLGFGSGGRYVLEVRGSAMVDTRSCPFPGSSSGAATSGMAGAIRDFRSPSQPGLKVTVRHSRDGMTPLLFPSAASRDV